MKYSKNIMLVFLGLTTTLFLYVILRAYFVGFTYDESTTFTILLGNTRKLFIANNHWLNTALSFLSFKLFGSSEFSLRLPNVLGFLVYSYFCYKLVIENSKYILSVIPAFIFLMLNPFVTDFFSLARGYGLAMAFFSGSLYYFLKFSEKQDNTVLAKGLILSVATIYSNYSFVIPIIALHLGYLLHAFREKNKQYFCKKKVVFFCIEAAALLPALVNILVLKKRKLLYFGGTKNIVEDTFFSIFNVTYLIEVFSGQNWVILLVIVAVLSYGLRIKNRGSLNFMLIVFLAALFLTMQLHLILGMKYPIGRSAIYWVIISGVYLHLFLENLFEMKRNILSYLFIVSISGVSMLAFIGFLSNINLSYTLTWKHEADTRSMLETINDDIEKEGQYSLGTNWIFRSTINYYLANSEYNILKPAKIKSESDKKYDYYYVFDDEYFDVRNKRVLKHFNTSKTILFKSQDD